MRTLISRVWSASGHEAIDGPRTLMISVIATYAPAQVRNAIFSRLRVLVAMFVRLSRCFRVFTLTTNGRDRFRQPASVAADQAADRAHHLLGHLLAVLVARGDHA